MDAILCTRTTILPVLLYLVLDNDTNDVQIYHECQVSSVKHWDPHLTKVFLCKILVGVPLRAGLSLL